jgi:Protein of unknown function (DUF1236)
MFARNRVMTVCLVGATAAILTLAMPVVAQVPASAPATAPLATPQDTVNLTMEQRHVIKEIILKDLKVTATQGDKVPTKVGDTVPTGVPLQPMPVEVSAKIPQIKSHSFLVKDDKVVIVDPKDNKVAALIE